MATPRPFAVLAPALVIFIASCSSDTGTTGEVNGTMILATTTSTYDSGLLDELTLLFQEKTGVTVKVIAVGTGAALRMAGEGNADAVLVHAPEAEAQYVASGDLVSGRMIMTNDFVIVGPATDPAGASTAPNLTAALEAIAVSGRFVSRGDQSGTHQRELMLWNAAGIEVATLRREETGQGMGATLNIADQRHAYTLTDRATYLTLRDVLDLVVLVESDPALLNVYHAYVVSPRQHTDVKSAQAEAFVDFLASERVQALIGEFRLFEFGQPLFIPAVDTKAAVGDGG